MSRLGVVRWLPNLDPMRNTSSNITSPGSQPIFMSICKEEWMQADAIISAVLIAMVVAQAHFCSLSKVGISTLFSLASLILTLLLAPIVGCILFVFTCYRQIASFIIKHSVGEPFAGLLQGADAFWALEEDTSLSVINVLALADFSFIVSASTQGDEPLQTILELIQERLLTEPVPFSKLLCYRRQSVLGYFYWEKQDCINISDHIRWMDIEDQGDQTVTESSLKNYISSEMNSPLPSHHAAGWEILVGRYPIKPSSDLFDAMENGGWITKSNAGVRYPVLFRVHHSIGDGVALVNLLLDSLGDPCSRASTPVLAPRCRSPSFYRNFVRPKSPVIPEEPEDEEEEPIISSWQESDIPRCTKSTSCDLQSICLDIPTGYSISPKRRNSFDSISYTSMGFDNRNIKEMKSNMRQVCKKFLNFVHETREFKSKISQNKATIGFDIFVNNRPSGEFVDLINNATNLENPPAKFAENKKRLHCMIKVCTKGICYLLGFVNKLAESVRTIAHQWSVLLFAPASLFNQAISQPEDMNLLHGPRLSGHKVVAWYFEQQDNSNQLLMSMIKRIRAKTGVRFSDVVLTAVSSSLESFYSQCNEIPHYITVVIPARLGPAVEMKYSTTTIRSKTLSKTKVTKVPESCENTLENKFSVAMLPLPIANSSSTALRNFCKLKVVKKHCDLLRSSPDYIINYWVLRVIAQVMPIQLLRPLTKSTHSTLVLSNLPGPTRLTKLAGHTLHDLVFWVPNRTTTGVGITILSYAGRLQLGLIADRSLIACQQDAQLILDGVASTIQQMDQLSSPT